MFIALFSDYIFIFLSHLSTILLCFRHFFFKLIFPTILTFAPYFPYTFYLFLYLCLLPLLILNYHLLSPNDFTFFFVNFSFLCVSLISLIPSSLIGFHFSIILFLSFSFLFLTTLFSSFPLTLVLTFYFFCQIRVPFSLNLCQFLFNKMTNWCSFW
jgi:hypothetical protein